MRRFEFSSTMLLKRAEKGERAFRRLKNILLLILRTLCLAFLVLGFANPGILRRQSIVVLDNSYDMLTKSGEHTLFEQGNKIANRLKAKGSKIILSSGAKFPSKCEYKKFCLPIEGISHIITKAGKLPPTSGIKLIGLKGGDNFSIDSLFFTPTRIGIGITNFTEREKNKLIALFIDSKTLETRLTIAPYSTGITFFPFQNVYAGSLKIEQDALSIDDVRYFVHPLLPELKVLLVGNSRELFFLKNALSPEEGDSRISVEISPKIKNPRNYDVLAFSSISSVYMGEKTLSFPREATRLDDFLTLNWISNTHPIFSGFKFLPELKKIKFTRRKVIPKEGKVIARFSDGTPAIIESASGGLIFSFPLSQVGEVVLSPLFVPLMHRVAYWLAGKPIEEHNFIVGERVKFKVPEFKSYKCIGPSLTQEITPKIEADGIYICIMPETPGIYEIEGITKFAVNISSKLLPSPLKIKETPALPAGRKDWLNLKKLFFVLVLLLLVAELIIRRF